LRLCCIGQARDGGARDSEANGLTAQHGAPLSEGRTGEPVCRPYRAKTKGNVERSQLTDLNEFSFHHAPTKDEIDQRIEEWQFDYN
jgi:hypothetical protein